MSTALNLSPGTARSHGIQREQPQRVVAPLPPYNPTLRAKVDAERAPRPAYQGKSQVYRVGVWFGGEREPYGEEVFRAVSEGAALRAMAHRYQLRPHQLRGPRPEYKLGVIR